jgi:hypothetical protein
MQNTQNLNKEQPLCGWMDVQISRIFTRFLRILIQKIRKNLVKIREIRTSIPPTQNPNSVTFKPDRRSTKAAIVKKSSIPIEHFLL